MAYTEARRNAKPLATAGVLLGLGLGGFLDGILFHQVLQWHHMFTSADDAALRTNLGLNITADGVFHLATWALTALGLILLWRAVRRSDVPRSGRVLGGSILAGAGLFNLVEGIIDHQILGIHHVNPAGNVLLWDLAYLALGALLLVVGVLLARSARAGAAAERRAVRRARA